MSCMKSYLICVFCEGVYTLSALDFPNLADGKSKRLEKAHNVVLMIAGRLALLLRTDLEKIKTGQQRSSLEDKQCSCGTLWTRQIMITFYVHLHGFFFLPLHCDLNCCLRNVLRQDWKIILVDTFSPSRYINFMRIKPNIVLW